MRNPADDDGFQCGWCFTVGTLEEKRLFPFFFKGHLLSAVGGRLKLKDAKSFSSFGILVRMKELVAWKRSFVVIT